MSQAAIGQLEQIAERIHRQLVKGQVPEMQIPTRSKSNIIFDDRQQVWKYGSARTTRTAKITLMKAAQNAVRLCIEVIRRRIARAN